MNALELIGPAKETLKKIRKPLRVIGIDLGTTNSTVAEIVYDPSVKGDISIRCIAVEQPTGSRSHWNPLVPSIVAIHDGQEIVGEGARLLRSKSREAGLIEESNIFASVPYGSTTYLQHGTGRLSFGGRGKRADTFIP